MRWFDGFLGLLAATMVFGSIVVRREGAPAEIVVGFLVAAAALAVAAFVRAARAPKVALVGDPDRAAIRGLDGAIDDAGYAVVRCDGPSIVRCPVLHGEPCDLARRAPVAAVVYRAARQPGPPAPCGRALRVPMVRVYGPAARDPQPGATDADPATVVAAMEEALATSRRRPLAG